MLNLMSLLSGVSPTKNLTQSEESSPLLQPGKGVAPVQPVDGVTPGSSFFKAFAQNFDPELTPTSESVVDGLMVPVPEVSQGNASASAGLKLNAEGENGTLETGRDRLGEGLDLVAPGGLSDVKDGNKASHSVVGTSAIDLQSLSEKGSPSSQRLATEISNVNIDGGNKGGAGLERVAAGGVNADGVGEEGLVKESLVKEASRLPLAEKNRQDMADLKANTAQVDSHTDLQVNNEKGHAVTGVVPNDKSQNEASKALSHLKGDDAGSVEVPVGEKIRPVTDAKVRQADAAELSMKGGDSAETLTGKNSQIKSPINMLDEAPRGFDAANGVQSLKNTDVSASTQGMVTAQVSEWQKISQQREKLAMQLPPDGADEGSGDTDSQGELKEVSPWQQKEDKFAKQLQSTSTVNTGPAKVMPAGVSFGQAQWASHIAERTALVAVQNMEMAEIKLDPAELGPLQVRVNVVNEQAAVTFVSANPAVREALEGASERLKELLGQENIELVDVDVSDSGSENHDEQKQELEGSAALAGNEVDELDKAAAQTMSVSYGVDSYV